LKLSAAWNLRRPLKDGRLEDLCAGADVVILRNDFQPERCAAPLVLTGADFAKGGSAELYRRGDSWRIVWAQSLRGHRPWTWGNDPR
jgi:competence protein ComEC